MCDSLDLTGVCAERLRVLADPTRLRVLRVLLAGPRHVREINHEIDVEQSLLSHHLRVLREAGLVQARRDGKAVLYALSAEIRCRGESLDLGCCRLTFDDPRE